MKIPQKLQGVQRSFEYLQDPGHGWIKVPNTLLVRLGISQAISPYSYIRQFHSYLEEDCDAALFVEAMRYYGVIIKLRHRTARIRESRIRNYDRYPSPPNYELVRQSLLREYRQQEINIGA